jgi:hypothetical protein
MTEAELDAGIARRDRLLDSRPNISKFLANTCILVTGAALIVTTMATSMMIGPAILAGFAIGGTYTFGGAFACKGVLSQALKQRNKMTDVYNAKVTVRVAAEQEASRLRNIKAAEDFNAAVDAGLPLEADIVVKPALKLRRPERPKHHGFARVKDIFDPRF